MKRAVLAVLLVSVCAGAQLPAEAPPPAEVQMEFLHEQLTPSHWLLTLHADGSGSFQADSGSAPRQPGEQFLPDHFERAIQISAAFTAQAFDVAARHHLFQEGCASERKVAFTGTKTLRFNGPQGKGSCSFNYSADRELQALADSMQSVARTLVLAKELELLVRHDRLGLDAVLAELQEEAKAGHAQQLIAMRETLLRLSENESLMERVRRRARSLLEQAESESAIR